jgi:Outer membrane lipoprotein-sorting protein
MHFNLSLPILVKLSNSVSTSLKVGVLAGVMAFLAEAQAAKAPPMTDHVKGFENLAPPDHALAQQVLSLALENQYQGNYRTDVEMVRSSYRDGIERLLGTLQVEESTGSRKLELKDMTGEGGYTYRSENFGAEQWVQDQKTQRMRRIANRQFKKSALGTDLTYEDLMRLPLDILRAGETVKEFRQTDSSYNFTLGLRHQGASFYSKVDAVVAKSPLRITSMVLYDAHGKRCKQVDITGYAEVQGKWLLKGFKVINCDSSASTWVALRNPVLPDPGSLAKADHVQVAPRMPATLPLLRSEWPLPQSRETMISAPREAPGFSPAAVPPTLPTTSPVTYGPMPQGEVSIQGTEPAEAEPPVDD